MRSSIAGAIGIIGLAQTAAAQTVGPPIELKPADLPRSIIVPIDAKAMVKGKTPQAPITPTTTDAKPDLRDPAVRRRIAEGLLGGGYDIWTNSPIPNRCVNYAPDAAVYASAVAGVPSPRNWSQINYVSNYSQHSSAHSFGVSATITYYAFSLGASHADSQANGYSSFSSYIEVDKGVVGDSMILVSPPGSAALSPSALARNALRSADATRQFTKSCGQAFISKVWFGEHIVGSMDFAVRMDSSAGANSTSVSIGVQKILGGAVSDANAWSDLASKSAMKYNVRGGPAQDQQPSNWLANILAYGADGKFKDANEVVFVEVTPYSALSDQLFAKFIDPATEAQASIVGFRYDYMEALQALTDSYAARDHPTIFKAPTPSIDDRIKALTDYMDLAGAIYLDCRKAVMVASSATCAAKAKALGPAPHFAPLELIP
ncbi:hypothetical protein EJC47_11000 [Sphingomonas sp. TF3]|uniref:hypothetical protein n=1 Tax=Sphingomonas sp. TF3 TaxID=2495580 RepID=UPI000F899A16|nr:hypothetical protein [Sphingomonas sp. TF3]RUN76492.1 hypothetical protein EJC47_11000 [Sphingomonas sp. TF3]